MDGHGTLSASDDAWRLERGGGPDPQLDQRLLIVAIGIIGALLARGVDPLQAAASAAFVHARAGAVGWGHGLIPGDLIDRLPAVFNDILE